MPLEWRLTPRSEANLKRFNRKIRKHGNSRAVREDLRKAIQKGAEPSLERVRRAARQLPSRGVRSGVFGRRDMRERIARATKLETRTARDPGAVIAISKRDMGDAPTLPKRMNEGSWRHPVYGNANVWVTQRSQQGWFDTAAKQGQDEVQRSLSKMIGDFVRKINT